MPLSVERRQPANDDRAPYTLGDAHWIGSILQQSNSIYFEGMSTPQHLVFVDIPNPTTNPHTLTFSHQATNEDIHANDFWLPGHRRSPLWT